MILRALLFRPLVREKNRSALTLLGIAVGVGAIVAVALANRSALRAFRQSVDAVSGRANYEIASNAPIDETLLLRLQRFWPLGVRFAPVIDLDGVLEPQQLPIRLFGVDLLSDLHFRDYRYATIAGKNSAEVSSALDAAAQARNLSAALDLFRHDSIIIPAVFAHDHHLTVGSQIVLDVLGHQATMTVRGILEPRGPATAFNGSIAVADIATAQDRFGMSGQLTRIDLLVPNDRLVPEIRRVLPPSVRLERPARRSERVDTMLRAFRLNLFALAGVTLLVGMFLVYNTVLISILRRRKDVGVLKTLGTSPRQIFLAFLCEGLLFGVVGSVAGIGLGVLMARGILQMIGQTINDLYVASRPAAVELTPGIVAVGMLVGVGLSLISALQPSIEAARVRPTILIQPGLHQRVGRRLQRWLSIAAIPFFALAAAGSFAPPINGIPVGGYAAVFFVVVGFSLLSPLIVSAASAVLEPPLRWSAGIVGELATASIPASLRRTAVAAAALALAIGTMIAVALMIGSFRETVRTWVRQTVSSDLWLRPAKLLSNADSAVFPAQIQDDLRRVPFIAAFDPIRGRDVVYHNAIIAVGSGDATVALGRGDLPMVAPRSGAVALRHLLAHRGVLVSESFSIKFHKRVGDTVRLQTARGMESFPISGIYRDYSNDRGVVFMDRSVYVPAFHDDAINTVVIYLRPGVSLADARARLETLFGAKYHAFTISNREIRGEVMKIFDQTFIITYALLAIALVVAVLGIVNALTALILERNRELALLRIVGMSIAEVRRMLFLESSILGLTSTVTGVVMGYILSTILIFVINKQSFGWTIQFHTPALTIALSALTTFIAAVVAGTLPARFASRINLAAAVKNE